MIIGTLIAGTTLAASTMLGLGHGDQAVAVEQHTAMAGVADAFAQPSLPDYCIFGTHHGKGSGCRGGSVPKGAGKAAGKVADDIGENGYEYGTIVGCGTAGAVLGTVATPPVGLGAGMGCEVLLHPDEAG